MREDRSQRGTAHAAHVSRTGSSPKQRVPMLQEHQQLCRAVPPLLAESDLIHGDTAWAQHHAKIISSLLVKLITSIKSKMPPTDTSVRIRA